MKNRTTARDLLLSASRATPGSLEYIAFCAAAFDSLTDSPLVLVGGGAQVLYTGIERLTDIDMVGWITPTDTEALASAGFTRDGRHWVYGGTTPELLVEIPETTLLGHDEPLLFQTPSGVTVRVISLDDLMLDRLMQATDGTVVTWEEALSLGIAAKHRINWTVLQARCDAAADEDAFLQRLPDVLNRIIDEVG